MKELYLCHICHAEINISFRTIWRSPKQWRQQLWESDFGHIFPDQEKLVLCIRIFKSGSPIHLFRWVEEPGRGRWWQDQSLADKSDLWNPAFQAMRRRRRRLLEEVRRGIVKVMRTKSLVEVARTKRNVEVARLRSCLVKVLSNYNRLSLISSSGSSIARLAKKTFMVGKEILQLDYQRDIAKCTMDLRHWVLWLIQHI